MDPNEYQVTIKSANQKVDDYMTKCRSSWTVHRLKQHIAETHVNKPNVEDQRLIYAGNLLKDAHTLKQIFFRDSLCTELTNSSKTDFTIHLVCATSAQKSAPTSSTSRNTVPPSQPRATVSSSAQTGPIPISSRGPTIPNRDTTPDQGAANGPRSVPSNMAPASSTNQQADLIRNMMQSEQMRQQLATFRQLACMVATQLAANLANDQSSNSLGGRSSWESDIAPDLMSLTNPVPNNIQTTASSSQITYATRFDRQQAGLAASDAHNSRPGVNQNDNINNDNNHNGAAAVGEPNNARFGFHAQVQAGEAAPVVNQPAPQAEPDIPMMRHDIIDWVYYSIRAAVLMAALYIHASIFRLLFIVGLLAIAYFCNRRTARRAPVRREPPVPQPAPVPQHGDERGDMETDGPVAGGGQAEEVPARVPFLKLCYLVVTDFLASLVPE